MSFLVQLCKGVECGVKHHTKELQVAGAVVLSAFVARKAYCMVRSAQAAAAGKARRAKQEKNVVYMFQSPRFEGHVGMSTACVKVEVFLRTHNIPYELIFTQDHSVSPTERFPCIELNGEVIAESQFIIEHVAKVFNIDLKYASKADAARETMLRRVCEDSLRLHYYRFLMVDSWREVVPKFAAAVGMPIWLTTIVVKQMFRKSLIKMLNAVGNGDLTNEQYHAEYLRDVQALEEALSHHKFATSETTLTLMDANVYPWLANMMWLRSMGLKCAALDYVANSAVLTAYIQNVTAAVFPDAAALTTKEAIKAATYRWNPTKA